MAPARRMRKSCASSERSAAAASGTLPCCRTGGRPAPRTRNQRPWLAAAAAAVMLVGGGVDPRRSARAGWSVSSLSGVPSVDGRAVTAKARMAAANGS